MSIKEKDGANKVSTFNFFDEIGAFVGSTPGTMLIARFCNAVDAGKIPSVDDLTLVANALKPLGKINRDDKSGDHTRKLLDQFGWDIGIKKRQGRKDDIDLQSGSYAEKMAESVIFYLILYERNRANGLSESKARTSAKKDSAKAAGIGERRMADRIKEYTPLATTLKEMYLHHFRTMKNWKDPEERIRLMNTDGYRYLCSLFE